MKNNNYPNWLVPLEIAEELKAIGFDEPCNHYVRISNDDIKLKINHSSIGLVILKRNSEYLNDDIASFITIPTWTQVFQWFRKRKIVGDIFFKSSTEQFKGRITFWNDVSEVWRTITTLGAEDYIAARNILVEVMIECYYKLL